MTLITEWVSKEKFEAIKKQFNPVDFTWDNRLVLPKTISCYYRLNSEFPMTREIVFNIIPEKLALVVKYDCQDDSDAFEELEKKGSD